MALPPLLFVPHHDSVLRPATLLLLLITWIDHLFTCPPDRFLVYLPIRSSTCSPAHYGSYLTFTPTLDRQRSGSWMLHYQYSHPHFHLPSYPRPRPFPRRR